MGSLLWTNAFPYLGPKFPSPQELDAVTPRNHPSRYFISSVTEDAKSKASQLSNDAKAELNKAKAKVGGTRSAGKIDLYSGKYFAACTVGGILACAPTHAAVCPLDLVKCRRQVDPHLYKSNIEGWRKIIRGEGYGGLFTGFGPTFIGYAKAGMRC